MAMSRSVMDYRDIAESTRFVTKIVAPVMQLAPLRARNAAVYAAS